MTSIVSLSRIVFANRTVPKLLLICICIRIYWVSGSKLPVGGSTSYPLLNISTVKPVVPIKVPTGVITSITASATNIRWQNTVTAYSLLPAIYQAFQDALVLYNVQFVPTLSLYNDCATGNFSGLLEAMTWDAYNSSIKLLVDDKLQGNLIIGPACTNDFLQVATATTAYPSNLIAGAGSMIDTVGQYPFVTRCAYNTYTQWNIFIQFALMHNWNSFATLYDYSDSTATTNAQGFIDNIQKTAQAAASGTAYAALHEVHFPLMATVSNYTDYLIRASKFARIYVLVMSGVQLRIMMLAAANASLIGGDYAFFTIDILKTDVVPLPTWQQNDSYDATAKQAYQTLFVITLEDKTGYPAYKNLQANVQLLPSTAASPPLSGDDPRPFFLSNYTLTYYAAAYYDCVMYTALAYYQAAQIGVLTNAFAKIPNPWAMFNVQPGLTVANILWGNTVLNGATGNMFVSGNGDRIEDFSLWSMTDISDGLMTVVGGYVGSTGNLTMTGTILWVGGSPPLNVPTCGYSSELCPSNANQQLYIYIGLGIGIPVLLIIMGFLFHCYRRAQAQKAIDEAWVAPWSQLKIHREEKDKEKARDKKKLLAMATAKKDNEVVSGASMGASMGASVGNSMGNSMGESMGADRVGATAFWNNQAVTIRPSKKLQVYLTTSLMKQARIVLKMEHDHIVPFLGACIEREHVMLLYEFCSKGSLFGAIASPKFKLDWTVKFSFIIDVIKGLTYMHNSPLKVHGRLTSLCCYVDSSFLVKLTDYGMDAFFDLTVAELWGARRDPEYRMTQVWKAPEHLVREASTQTEVINSVSVAGDIYSCGIIMQEAILRLPPFGMFPDMEPGDILEAVKRSVEKGSAQFKPVLEEGSCSAELNTLVNKCFSLDPAKRPSVSDLRKVMREQGRLLGMTDHSSILDTLLLQMEEQSARLQAIVDEKGRDLLDEKLRSDTLLYRILPKEIAETLKKGLKPNPESFELVTVTFLDILGFATIASESTPLQVIDFLNEFYKFMDDTIVRFDAYKVESLNDTTLVVSGLPVRNGILHAREIGRLALTVLFKINSFKIRHRPDDQVKLRTGVHSGPVVAGVVGLRLPHFCLFGDTINICSRMLTSGEPWKIQLSSMTKNILETFGSFRLVERGEIFVKGKGAMKTYWLMGEDGNMELLELQRKFEEEDIDEDFTDVGAS